MKISKNCFRRWFFAYVLSWFWLFLKIYVSHGSVATQWKCGGIFDNYFIANCSHRSRDHSTRSSRLPKGGP